MKLLLDTHTFIWWDSSPERLSRRAREALEEPENDVFLSVASLWELQIKAQLGKLELASPLAELLRDQRHRNALTVLPIEARHIFRLTDLPSLHRDPFDRLLMAQALEERAIFVSVDSAIAGYGIPILW